ncbi:MAG TPA: hypothetical protein DD671_20185, partial [Balneolaceae bacterium]|nr:hypothetical protein [Balneolaceae bacterium]
MSKDLDNHQAVLHELVDEITSWTLFDLNLKDVIADLDIFGKVWVLGAGKASVEMAKQLEDLFGDAIRDGMIV